MPAKFRFKKVLKDTLRFKAKTKLIDHYEKTLCAYHFKNQRMTIETEAARILVEKYFKI